MSIVTLAIVCSFSASLNMASRVGAVIVSNLPDTVISRSPPRILICALKSFSSRTSSLTATGFGVITQKYTSLNTSRAAWRLSGGSWSSDWSSSGR